MRLLTISMVRTAPRRRRGGGTSHNRGGEVVGNNVVGGFPSLQRALWIGGARVCGGSVARQPLDGMP